MSDLAAKMNNAGLKHFSASQLNKPVANWMFNYVYLNNEQRKKIIVGENAAMGTAAHEAIQAILCHAQDIDSATSAALMSYDLHPANKSEEKRVKFREVLPAMITQGVDLMAEKFGGSQEERRIELELEGVVLPIVGYVDLYKDDCFAEIKTKAPRQGARKKDGTRGWTKALLPKEPAFEHVLQAAIYHKATGAEPNIVYVSADSGIIFNSDNCEKLSDDYLAYAMEEVRRKCILRQNLLAYSDEPKVLAGLLEPDFGSFWWDDEYIAEAKKLWKL